MTDIRVSDVRFTAAKPMDRATGLLGFATLVLNDVLLLDGIGVRQTLSGAIVLSFPKRVDRHGTSHALVRPVDDAARRALTAQVLAALPQTSTATDDRRRQAESGR